MSIVRYVNKKTGVVALYESTSHYDLETKRSMPKRKYLGTEDPETGELITLSGKRGRKKAADGNETEKSRKTEESFQSKYNQLLQECTKKDARIK